MLQNILEYLENSAALHGDHVAFSDENSQLTFSQLSDAVRRIGTALAPLAAPHTPVAVYMQKSVQAIAGFFGAVCAGCCYAPIDVTMPQKRVELILQTLDTQLILTDRDSLSKVEALHFPGRVLVYEDLLQTPIDQPLLSTIRRRAIDTDPLYIIFTSGSTGVPKGVVLSHRAVIDLTEWLCDTFGFDSTTVFGNQTPFYFDASVKEIYSTLRCGATMHILPQKLFGFPGKLFPYLNEHSINTIAWATSAVCIAAEDTAFQRQPPQYLRTVIFAGEAMPVKQLNIWRKYLPDVRYVNLYGPTEAAVDATYYIVDREFADTEALPIGFPCRNMDVFVLVGDRLAAPGETGELCIRGTALAHGYYRNPEKTREVFVQNPLQSVYPELIYRTGDMGYVNQCGELMFAAREDDQIKHRGYRIELGEIETAISSICGIRRCCCLFDKAKDRILCVYAGSIDKKQITLALSQLLPKYMWPNGFICLEELPMNLNGKIDRTALKEAYIP